MNDRSPEQNPPGICDECRAATLFAWNDHTLLAHCHHTDTGAVGIFDGEQWQWRAWRPMTRDRFEYIADRAAKDGQALRAGTH